MVKMKFLYCFLAALSLCYGLIFKSNSKINRKRLTNFNNIISIIRSVKSTTVYHSVSPNDSNDRDPNDEIDNDEINIITFTKRKSKKDDKRDFLPFDIYMESKPDIKIGSFLLDASTACGDFIDLGNNQGIHNVKKVTFLYKYDRGEFYVFKKKLHLKPSKEKRFLNSIYQDAPENTKAASIISLIQKDEDHNDNFNNYLQ